MKNSCIDRSSSLQVLDHDALQQFRRDARVPHTFRIHDHNRPTPTHAEARGLTALHSGRAEQEPLAFEKTGQLRIERATSTIGRTEPSGAYQHVPAVRLEDCFVLGHDHWLTSSFSPLR